MSSILALAVFAVWVCICIVLTKRLGRLFRPNRWRVAVQAATCTVLTVLPLTDEIIGGVQFNHLCSETSALKIDANNIQGKLVRLVIEPSNQIVRGQVLRTIRSHYSYQIYATNFEVASFDTYEVGGGWLVRAITQSNTAPPMILGHAACSPPNRGMLDRIYHFKLVN